MILILFFIWHASFEITLAYLGIHNQLINCHISLNLTSRDLFKA